jgi:hypothetical protein
MLLAIRARKLGILYDDAYGLWTEDDQASAAAEAFAMMDREEERRGQPSKAECSMSREC